MGSHHMTSWWHHPWHHGVPPHDIIMTSCMTLWGPTTWHHRWHHAWHHGVPPHDIIMTSWGPTTWHHVVPPYDIIMTSSMTSSWHLSLSIYIHLTSVPTSVQRWSRQHIQCISLQYIFYTCIIQPTKSLHQLYGLGLTIGPTLGPKPNPLN